MTPLPLHTPFDKTPRRLPRNLKESGAVTPDWRYQQAVLYVEAAENQDYNLLELEDDILVIRLYAFMRHGTSGSTQLDAGIRYAIDAESCASDFGVGTRIKGYVMAGLSEEEIAERTGCDVESVDIFEKLFFDVREKRTCRDYMVSLALPMVVDRSENPAKRRERSLLYNSVAFGAEGLESALSRTVDITEAGLEKQEMHLRALVQGLAFDFLVMNKIKGNPQPENFERYINYLQVQLEKDPKSEGKIADFAEHYAQDIMNKIGLELEDKIRTAKPVIDISTEGSPVRRIRLTSGELPSPHTIDLTAPVAKDENNAGSEHTFSLESY